MVVAMRTILLTLVAALVLVGTASAATKPKITGTSFTHPVPNPGYSYVCAKLKGKANSVVSAVAIGPNGAMSTRVHLDANGKGLAVWKITAPGDYRFQASAAG